MASIPPRASGFWEDSRSMASAYFSDDDDGDGDSDQQSRLLAGDDSDFDDRTRLDKTIDRIGMGAHRNDCKRTHILILFCRKLSVDSVVALRSR